MAWSIVGTFLSTVIYVEAAPTALAKIQWKYYLIFIVLTAVNIVILYLWCPEVNSPHDLPLPVILQTVQAG